MRLCVIVLAGGEGRRIGGGKPLKTLHGERLIDRALHIARRWSDHVAVAVRDTAQVEAEAKLVLDEPGVEGPLAGLIAAGKWAAACGCELVLAIPADMPFLPDDLASRLHDGLGDANAALASSGGQLHPVCGLWRVAALEAAGDYVAAGRRSLRGFAAAVGFRNVAWPAESGDPFFNINLSADLDQAERRLRG